MRPIALNSAQIITLVSRHHSVVAEDVTEGELFKLHKLDEIKRKYYVLAYELLHRHLLHAGGCGESIAFICCAPKSMATNKCPLIEVAISEITIKSIISARRRRRTPAPASGATGTACQHTTRGWAHCAGAEQASAQQAAPVFAELL